MSMRSIIAYQNPDQGWQGVYHHHGGEPSMLGRTLWFLYQHRYRDRFQDPVKQMILELITDRPCGWSTLNTFHPETGRWSASVRDWDGRAVYPDEANPGALPVAHRPYAHTDGTAVTGPEYRDSNTDARGFEYVYVLRDSGMLVLESRLQAPAPGVAGYAFVPLVTLHWDLDEPDWESLGY